jgi:predicted RNA-binding protein with TRAM domain
VILILKFGVFNWFKISNFASKIDGKVKKNEFIIILNNAVVPFNTKIKISDFSHNKIFIFLANVRCR